MAWPWTFATLPAGNVAASKLDDNFNAAAQLDSPAFTGTPTTTNATQAVNSSQIANTAYVDRVAVQQVVYSQVSAASSGSTRMPFDGTIPQNTEGDQYLSVTITPKSASSLLKISVTAYFWANFPDALAYALFQDSTANAIAAGFTYTGVGTASGWPAVLTKVMVSGTTSATTFKFRAGSNGPITVYFNSTSVTQVLGSAMNSIIMVEEIGV